MTDEIRELEATGGPDNGLAAGKRIGTYEIIEQVGRGGMGIVYRARDLSLDRDVALKILLPHLANDREFEKRFGREARAAAKLDHPNIVQTYTAGRFENLYFIAMQFVRGRTIYELGAERGRFSSDEALRIIRQAAEGLQAAHASGLVHRDIKPNNIMVDESGRVKVMDFGLMRSATLSKDHITETGIFFGTPEYSSPEQCGTAEIDGRSDIYSLGAVLYEMLAARPPHVAETPLALFKKISEEAPLPIRELNPEVSKSVEKLLSRMMAKNRDERHPDCAALIADIDAVLSGKSPVTLRRTRSAGSYLGLAAVAAAIVVALGLFAWRSPGKWSWSGDSGRLDPKPVLHALTMAVFDFRNGTGRAEDGWYEIALSDMLIASLAQRDGLRLPTRDQMLWKVKDLLLGDRVTSENQRRLLEELAADYYVAGTYYVKGPKIRVTLACYRQSDRQPAFDPLIFERPESELFKLIDDIASAIVGRLEEKIGGKLAREGGAPMAATEHLAAATFRGTKDGRTRERGLFQPAATLGSGGDALKAPPRPAAVERGLAEKAEKKDLDKSSADGNFSPVSDVELTRHWYANRRLAERTGAGEDDVKILVANLKDQLQFAGSDAAHLQKSLENFRICVDQVGEGCRQGGGQMTKSIEYVCVTCGGEARKAPGACASCGAPLAIRLRIQVQERKKP